MVDYKRHTRKVNMPDANSQVSNGEGKAVAQYESSILGGSGHKGQVRMSFDPATPDGAVKLVKATLQECKTLESKAKERLTLTDFIIHPASAAGDAEGEVSEFDRIVVFDADGEAYSCGSLGVAKSLAVLELTCGKAPWRPGVVVTVKVTRTSNKNNWMILEPDIAELQKRLSPKK